MSQMLKSSGAMAAATMTSRVFGLAREIVYARFMGTGWVAAAFQLAFTIPNLFRRLLGEGALTAAFIPIFKEKERTQSEAEMWRAANAVISGLIVAASVIIGLVLLGISVALAVHEFDAKYHLMLQLLRVMFPYMLLVCLTAVFMGMLNARGHFFIPAMGATVLNLVMIASVLWLAPCLGGEIETQIFALAVGVLVAGVAQAAFQLPVLRREGFRYRWESPWANETVRVVVKRMIPGTIGVAVFQLNVVMVQLIAFWVDPTIVASFNFAVRLMELPQGVFGISLATFLLPALSGLAAEKKYPEFRTTLGEGLGVLVFINVIASVLLVVLAEPIIRLLFERGEFTSESTRQTFWALIWLAPGLVAFSMNSILARAFYALGDTQTPMRISVVCLALNLILTVWLIGPLRQGGLGLANTLSGTLNVGLLLYALRRKLGRLELSVFCRSLGPLALAGVLAGVLAWWSGRLWQGAVGHGDLIRQFGAVFVPAAAAGAVYWSVALGFGVRPAREVGGLILRRLKPRP